ncbi:BnaCnng56260D, partial [Brassica napus]
PGPMYDFSDETPRLSGLFPRSTIREKVTQRKGLCLISRHHPDILAVVNEPGSQWKEPWAYNSFCLTHQCSQFPRLFPDHHHTQYLVMKAGSSSQKAEFDSYTKDIKEKSPEGWKWLEQIPPHQWTLAHDSGGVMLLFDELRDAFDVSFRCSRGSRNRGDVYTEFFMDKLRNSLKDSASYVVKPLERDAFQVSGPSRKKGSSLMGRKFKEYKEGIVQLNDSTCTCGKFQRKKFPCLHALAVCKKMKISHLQYVDDWYSAERYHKTYAATFSSVPEMSTWLEASGVPTLFPPIIAPPPLKVSGIGKGKSKEPPSDEELRNAILDILKAIYFKKYELDKYAADSEEEEEEDEENDKEEAEEEEEV